MIRSSLALALALVVVVWALPGVALPRFAIREGLPCTHCHVNPSGGGMRNDYGRYVFETTRLPATYPWSKAPRDLLDVEIGKSLAFGGDLRVAFIDQRPGDGSEGLRTFFLMQADLYLSLKLFEGLTLYYDRGAYGGFEAFGLYEHRFGAQTAAYVKLGRFMPTYGLRLENHNTFVREQIGFGPTDKDVGVEAGAYIGPVLLQAALLNGAGPDRQLDDNHDKAVVGRLEAAGRAGALRLMFGVSAYRNIAGSDIGTGGASTDTRSRQLRTEAHAGFGIGRFAYLAEADLIRVDPFANNTQDSKERSLRTYQELDVLLVQGMELTFSHEYRDTDLGLRSGTAKRLGAGFELFPVPFTELKVLYRHTLGRGPAEQAQRGFDEIVAMAHLFF